VALSVLASLSLQAADRSRRGRAEFPAVSLEEARRELPAGSVISTPAAMWVWSDKYVYSAGQPLTIRWTVKPNNDPYPYTIVAYLQNNQTGVKTYLPGGATATDIFGNTPAQGFQITRLPSAEKAVLAGAGGMFPVVTVSDQLGMHTIVVQVRDYTGTRIVKAAYWKIGVVNGTEVLSGEITADRTLTNDKQWNLTGVVLVKGGAILTIQPGTFIIGQPGSQPPSAIVVGNTGKIRAAGTRSRPIIMTSSLPFGQRRGGDWGGLVLLGQAPTNWPNGTGNIEGLPPGDDTLYGGADANHDCGTLRYVRLEFAGAELGPNDEINAFTWGGCGKQTVAEYLQSSYGLDDAFEWFGGTSDARYLAGAYARDDYFDGQIGWTGKVQFGVALANADNSNRGIEMDNNEFGFTNTPKSIPQFYNMTFIGVGDQTEQGADEPTVAGAYLRRGTGGRYNNMLFQNWVDGAINLDGDATLANVGTDLTADGILMWQNGVSSGAANTPTGQVSASAANFITNTAKNVVIADPLLRRPFEYSNPDFRPQIGSPVFRANWVQPPDDGFFDQSATFIGAFGEIDWTEEWTNFIQEEDIAP
jgi:hypothetical protein